MSELFRFVNVDNTGCATRRSRDKRERFSSIRGHLSDNPQQRCQSQRRKSLNEYRHSTSAARSNDRRRRRKADRERGGIERERGTVFTQASKRIGARSQRARGLCAVTMGQTLRARFVRASDINGGRRRPRQRRRKHGAGSGTITASGEGTHCSRGGSISRSVTNEPSYI